MSEKNEHTRFLRKQAEKRGIKCAIFKSNEDFCILQKGKKQVLVDSGIVAENQSASAYNLCKHKAASHEYLKKHKYPVLPQKRVASLKEAMDFFEKHKKVVLKPLKLKQGKGVIVNIQKRSELRAAWKISSKFSKFKIIEKFVKGIDHRILVIDYTYVYAILRLPAYVYGDGEHTVRKLIEMKNEKKTPGKRKKPIKIDDSLRLFLRQQRLSLRYRPKKGEKVILRGTANVHTGGETRDFTDQISSAVKKEAIRIAKNLKMSVLGIDYLAEDINKKRYIIELEGEPGIQTHHFPMQGRPRDPMKKFLDMIFQS